MESLRIYWRNMVLGNMHFIKANVRHRQNVAFCTMKINLWILWCLGVLETFGRFSRKYPWGSHFFMKESEILLKEGLYHRCLLSRKIFKNGWLLTAPSEQLGRLLLMYFNFLPQQLLSAVVCDVTLNVNKIFLQIALLEPTP